MIYRTKGGMCVRVAAHTPTAIHGTLYMWSGVPRALQSVELYWDVKGNCCRALCHPSTEWIFHGNERQFFDLDLKREPEVETLS